MVDSRDIKKPSKPEAIDFQLDSHSLSLWYEVNVEYSWVRVQHREVELCISNDIDTTVRGGGPNVRLVFSFISEGGTPSVEKENNLLLVVDSFKHVNHGKEASSIVGDEGCQ